MGRTVRSPSIFYLTFNAPHTPYQAPKEYIAKYSDIADQTRRTYAAKRARRETAGRESARPLALLWIMQTAMKSAIPLLPTDEGFYTDSDDGNMKPTIGTAH